MKKLRVIVADDHPVVRLGICNALQKESDIDVVAEAEDGAQALALTGELHPDVLILDAQMPKMDGLAATRAVRAQYPRRADPDPLGLRSRSLRLWRPRRRRRRISSQGRGHRPRRQRGTHGSGKMKRG